MVSLHLVRRTPGRVYKYCTGRDNVNADFKLVPKLALVLVRFRLPPHVLVALAFKESSRILTQ